MCLGFVPLEVLRHQGRGKGCAQGSRVICPGYLRISSGPNAPDIRIGPNDPDICAVSRGICPGYLPTVDIRGICPGIQRRYPGHRPNFCIVSTKPTLDTVHSPTPGQLHVESIQLACTCALCCCYALCMKREELSIFYSLWLRCFVVMLQYAGFLGRSQLFGSQVKVGAPTQELARAKSGFGARQLPHSSCSFAPRAPYTLHAFPLPSRHLITLLF